MSAARSALRSDRSSACSGVPVNGFAKRRSISTRRSAGVGRLGTATDVATGAAAVGDIVAATSAVGCASPTVVGLLLEQPNVSERAKKQPVIQIRLGIPL